MILAWLPASLISCWLIFLSTTRPRACRVATKLPALSWERTCSIVFTLALHLWHAKHTFAFP